MFARRLLERIGKEFLGHVADLVWKQTYQNPRPWVPEDLTSCQEEEEEEEQNKLTLIEFIYFNQIR